MSQFEPLVEEMPLLEVKKMSKESKRAFHRLINEYYEAMYVLEILEELGKQFKLFDPIAKKYKEAEVEARKKAEITGKKVAIPARTFAGSSELPSRGSTYTPLSSRPTYPGQFGATSTYGPPSQRTYSSASSQPGYLPSRKSQPRALPTAKPDSKKAKTKSESEQELAPDGTNKLTQDLNLMFSKIEDKLRTFNKALEDSAMLKKIDSSIIDASPIDYSLAVETVPDLSKALNMQKGLLGDIHQYHRKSTNKRIRETQKKRLKQLYDKNKKNIEELQKKLTEIKNRWDSLKEKVPVAKQYAFFGMKDIAIEIPEDATEKQRAELTKNQNQLTEAKSRILAPYSVFEISELIDTIRTAIDSFDQNTLPEVKKP